MSDLTAVLTGWLPAVGGVVGLATIIYFSLMVRLHMKKDRQLTAIEVRLAKIEGLLLGRRGR